MFYALEGNQPELEGEGHFVAPNAAVVGNVLLKDKSSVWFNAVIRGDNERITIGERSNIQDGSVLHTDPGYPLTIGADCTIGHKVMLHGCTIGDGTLIGINAVVLNGAKIGSGCLIGANALVTEGMEVPDGSMVLGSPGKIKRTLDDDSRAVLKINSQVYMDNSARFAGTLKAVDVG